MKFALENLKFDARGLVPAVVQDARTGEVLTLAYMNAESLRRTLDAGETWFWSRSRRALWHKGETSGNTQRVVELRADCDGDALVALVEPAGAACHTGARSCFHHEIEGADFHPATPARRAVDDVAKNADSSVAADVSVAQDVSDATVDASVAAGSLGDVLAALYSIVASRREARPEGSYTSYLFDAGLDKILKKVGEEAAETIIAAKNAERGALVSEVSDLVYHLVVLLVERGVALDALSAELARRGAQGSGKAEAGEGFKS